MTLLYLLLGCIAAYLLGRLIYRVGYWTGMAVAVAHYEGQSPEPFATAERRENSLWN